MRVSIPRLRVRIYDGQMRTMLINELEVNPAKLIRVLHYDGTPITARFIIRSIHDSVAKEAV